MHRLQSYSVFDVASVLSNGEYIRMDDTGFKGSLPVPIRPGRLFSIFCFCCRSQLTYSAQTGDYNLDGYPDLLVVTNQRVVLLESVLCDTDVCTQEATDAYRRSFKMVSKGADALSKDISNPRQAAFFDIAEDVCKHTKRFCMCNATDAHDFTHFFRVHSIYLYYKLKDPARL
jgi:integrin alpha FG-GAP repeat containing protein 1